MSDSDEDTCIPSAEECERRSQQFAEITSTDTALAMFYLQDRQWNVDLAVNAFYEEAGGSVLCKRSSASVADTVDLTSDDGETKKSKKLKTGHSSGQEEDHNRFRLMSWNIDGLDTNTAIKRTKTVCEIIKKERPHVVLLQEVVNATLEVIEKECPMYQVIAGGEVDYFTAILLKAGSIEYEDTKITQYPNTFMMRNLLSVKCKFASIPLCLLTSHLESTAEYSAERKVQLKIAFGQMVKENKDRTVIFGGDLNLRDKELTEIGGIPSGIKDLWEVTGSRPEAKYTWDMTRNDNLVFNGKFKPRCRFDRLYIRQPSPSMLKPVYFELIGLEKIRAYGRFPSDHWGLLTHSDIIK